MNNKQYLSKDRITELKNYLNAKLPAKVRAGLLQLKLKTGISFYYDRKENQKLFWNLMIEKYKADPQQKPLDIGEIYKNGDLVHAYISRNYKAEQDIINAFDPDEIRNFFRPYGIPNLGWCYDNGIDNICLTDFIECQSIDKLIDERYSEKNVEPELLKNTELFIKAILTFYKDVEINSNEYFQLRDATDNYLQYYDKQKLHNLLNKKQS
jgi:hypothetical protein